MPECLLRYIAEVLDLKVRNEVIESRDADGLRSFATTCYQAQLEIWGCEYVRELYLSNLHYRTSVTKTFDDESAQE